MIYERRILGKRLSVQNDDKTAYYSKPVIHRFDIEKEAIFFKGQVVKGVILDWGDNRLVAEHNATKKPQKENRKPENCCKNRRNNGDYDGWNDFYCEYYQHGRRAEKYDCAGFIPNDE